MNKTRPGEALKELRQAVRTGRLLREGAIHAAVKDVHAVLEYVGRLEAAISSVHNGDAEEKQTDFDMIWLELKEAEK